MDKELLQELTDHEGYPELLALLEEQARAIESGIIKANLGEEPNPIKFLVIKARAEGARQLAAAVKRQLESLRPKSKP